MPTLDLIVDFPQSLPKKIRRLSTRFNDGYEERAPDGINPIDMSVSIRKANITDAEKDAIEAELLSYGGTTAFNWSPDGSATDDLFTCTEYDFVAEGPDVWTLTAKLELTYEP